MAGTTTKSKRTQRPGSDMDDLLIHHNRLVDDLENLRRAVSYMMPGAVISGDPALKAGTGDPKTLRTEAVTINARGKPVSVAATEKAFTATTHDVAASKQAWFVLSVQSDGTTFTITKAADQNPGTDVLPVAPDNEIVLGYCLVVVGAGGIWDATTDNLAAGAGAGPVSSVTFTSAPPIGAAAFTGAKIGNASGVAIS